MTEETPPPGNAPDLEPDPSSDPSSDTAPAPSFARTLLQFFVIPMAVVAVGVGLFLFVAWMVSDDTTAADHLQRLRSGGSREKRQAAFELANRIQHAEPAECAALGPELVAAFEEAAEATGGEPFVRQYLALALGRLADPATCGEAALAPEPAAPALVPALSDADDTVRVYAAWALGAIGGETAVAALDEASRADDAGLRTMAVYGLGAIGDPAGREALLRAVDDPVLDVSMNAVVALARLGDSAAEARLLGMMDPEAWTGVPGMLDGERAAARLSAVRAAAALDSPAVRARLREVADADPELRVREAALAALAGASPAPR